MSDSGKSDSQTGPSPAAAPPQACGEGEDRQGLFIEWAEQFRAATDPEVVTRLGDELGRMIFGSTAAER